ncbi:hypothetical protein BGZ51_008504, partial [Haplosporangium sp. Z 767]
PEVVSVDTAPILNKRCAECTHKDGVALSIIVINKASADHYAEIAYAHLDNLMHEIKTANFTSRSEELPKKKALLRVTVQANIDKAKAACASKERMAVIEATVAINANLDISWSKKEEIALDRIQSNVNAEILSKDYDQRRDSASEIVPAPEIPFGSAPAPENPAPVSETSEPILETPAPVLETVAPIVETSKAEESPANNNGGLQVGIDVAANIDPKFVCKIGYMNASDARTVLSLQVKLQKEFAPRPAHFYQ